MTRPKVPRSTQIRKHEQHSNSDIHGKDLLPKFYHFLINLVIIIFSFFLGGFFQRSFKSKNLDDECYSLIISTISELFLFLPSLFFIIFFLKKSPLHGYHLLISQELKQNRGKFIKNVFALFCFSISTLPFNIEYNNTFSSNSSIIKLISVCFIPSIVEECLLRGWTFFYLSQDFSYIISAIISSAYFVLMHKIEDILSIVLMAFFALSWCYTDFVTKSIWPSILSHFFHNLTRNFIFPLSISHSFGNSKILSFLLWSFGAILLFLFD